LLSRRKAQEIYRDYIYSNFNSGDIINAKITHLESFGAFCDIGCGIIALLPIDAISVSRISHPSDRFAPGQMIYAVVRGFDPLGRVMLSHKELLGTWEENAACFESGQTVAGIVRSVEQYGIFVELTPNLAGLAEPFPDARPGQHASVYIKSLIPEKMKVKLMIVDTFDPPAVPSSPPRYFITQGRLRHWQYSPEGSPKQIETTFY
jgi:small subunit ribosomal protein S1